MTDNLKRRLYPRNPLGIIALFVFLIEAISTISLKSMLETQSKYVGEIVWFIILFPSIIAVLFFYTLWWRRESFYSPGDFKEDETFVNLIQKVDHLDLRQEAAQLDPAADIEILIKTIDKLVEKNDLYTAIQVGRSSLKESQYDASHRIFEHLQKIVPSSHDLYSRILANLAYSLIGLGKFEEAIDKLLEVNDLREEKRFYVWHALALAYSYYRLGKSKNYKQWVNYARRRKEYSVNLPLMIKLYPEIASDLRSPKLGKHPVGKKQR